MLVAGDGWCVPVVGFWLVVTVVRVGAGGGDGVNRVDRLPTVWIGGKDWWAHDLRETHCGRLIFKLFLHYFHEIKCHSEIHGE